MELALLRVRLNNLLAEEPAIPSVEAFNQIVIGKMNATGPLTFDIIN